MLIHLGRRAYRVEATGDATAPYVIWGPRGQRYLALRCALHPTICLVVNLRGARRAWRLHDGAGGLRLEVRP